MKDSKGPEKPLDEEDIFLPVESTLELSDLIAEGDIQADFAEPEDDSISESEPVNPLASAQSTAGSTGPEPLPTVGPAIEEVSEAETQRPKDK